MFYKHVSNDDILLLLNPSPEAKDAALDVRYRLFPHYRDLGNKFFSLGRWHSMRAFNQVLRDIHTDLQSHASVNAPLPDFHLAEQLYTRWIKKMWGFAIKKQRKIKRALYLQY